MNREEVKELCEGLEWQEVVTILLEALNTYHSPIPQKYDSIIYEDFKDTIKHYKERKFEESEKQK